jgi:isopentenyl diphosphate isomerase/L-lactate dehydrogenase-like FMN-dependent dehydrogenase
MDISKLVPEPVMPQNAGDSNRITRDYYDSLLIEYRHIGAVKANTEFRFFGHTFSSPVMAGGMAAMVPGMHEGGMAELARGAKEADTVFWSGYVSDREFEEACQTGASCVRIIKPMRDNQKVIEAIKHDEACGAVAYAVDIDHGFNDEGEYFPEVPHAYSQLGPKTMEELWDIATASALPWIAKGVLSVHDAVACVEAGAEGLLLSHHKGEYRYAVPPVYVLPEIRKAMGPEIKIYVDCGIASGIDAFKALALGADGVCVARPLMKPFASDGAKGVADTLIRYRKELAGVMCKTCSPSIDRIDPSVIRRKNW